MKFIRSVFAGAVSGAFKSFAIVAYSAFALKIGFIDSNVHPLFALFMVLLSIYGLWRIVGALAAHAERLIKGDAEASPLR
jgi:hypothetical protein